MGDYIQLIEDKSIYKFMIDKGSYLKISPYQFNEYRWFSVDTIKYWLKNHIAHEISKQKALQIKNQQWDLVNEIWKYKGIRYSTIGAKNVLEEPGANYKFNNIYYGLCYYQGNIKWYVVDPFRRAILYDFINIETPPTGIGFYTGVKHLHPIYKEDYDYKNRKNIWKII